VLGEQNRVLSVHRAMGNGTQQAIGGVKPRLYKQGEVSDRFVRFGSGSSLPAGLSARTITPSDVARHGVAKLGLILGMIDEAGGDAAGTMSPGRPIATAGLDRMEFGPLPKCFDKVVTTARVTGTGRFSTEVEVTTRVKNASPDRPLVAKGYLTFATIGEHRVPVEPFKLATDSERKDVQAFAIRRDHRRAEANAVQAVFPHGAAPVDKDEVEKNTLVTYQTTQKDANRNGKVFGGVALDVMYQAGQKAARQFINSHVKLVRQDRMNFEKAGEIGDRYTALPMVTRSWQDTQQLEVQVDLLARKSSLKSTLLGWALPSQRAEEHRIATTYFTFQPRAPLAQMPFQQVLTTPQQNRWEGAEIRRLNRDAERSAISAL
jgi:acyl-CoA hydrolase